MTGNSVIDFKFLSINVHYILIYYWVLRRPQLLGTANIDGMPKHRKPYKSYWRKSGLKGKWGDIFLERLSNHNPRNDVAFNINLTKSDKVKTGFYSFNDTNSFSSGLFCWFIWNWRRINNCSFFIFYI